MSQGLCLKALFSGPETQWKYVSSRFSKETELSSLYYFQESAYLVVGAGKSKICRAGPQGGSLQTAAHS